MSLTAAQQEAISARGNVLVVAGAGTGKTRTLVERCLACLLSEKARASIDEILVVTFTEAAAAEMRQRIRDRLEEERQGKRHEAARWQEQLALFETAHIGTLHSFCFQLVRQHFYQLELDPQLAVLSEEEARLLAAETLDKLFQRYYSGKDPAAQAVQRLIQVQARGWDKPIRALVLRLHHYEQTLPDPAVWLEEQLGFFATPEPMIWHRWLLDAYVGWPQEWLPALDLLSHSNPVAARCAAALRKVQGEPSPAALAAVFAEIALARKNCPRGKKSSWHDPLKEFFGEADFLASLGSVPARPEPLAEDWTWVREQMSALLELSREFTQSFTEAKRELGVVDFHDLEQYCLRLLWDPTANQPTGIARQWRNKLRFVFVDEYQDINAAQDRIIQALSRESSQANRFLVGDVKQSIYRFRLANPRIFQDYTERWANGPNKVISLVENFRGREGLIEFTNSVFGLLMRRDLGGIQYDSSAALRFGVPQERQCLSLAQNAKPCAELHLLLNGGEESPETEEQPESISEVMDLQAAEKEARLIAQRLRELHGQKHPVWDAQNRQFRPVDWRDMAILLRSPAKKAESYAKEFARLNLPLEVARGGFYQSIEISDLLSLLQLLDNPLQDLPVLAVLHSPLVGLNVSELAEIRLTAPKARFWSALISWHRTKGAKFGSEGQGVSSLSSQNTAPDGFAGFETHSLVSRFLKRFARWRRLARQVALSRCLETVLAETHYAAWLLTQPRGQERHAHVQRLLLLAQEFDRFQRQGLFRFLKFVEAQQAAETEPEVAVAPAENAVRLMSIHQSKGLEFPVVVVADAAKPFNLVDLRADIILDEKYGLCPQIKPPHTGKRYPSLPYWLARKRQRRELLGEELRLLYVAMTRARDLLLLSGSVSHRAFAQGWLQQSQPDTAALLGARSYSDWLALWFSHNVGIAAMDLQEGSTHLLRWFIHHHSELAEPVQTPTEPPEEANPITFGSESWSQLEQRLSWQYPFSAATQQPAKTSVSALRRQAVAEFQDEVVQLFPENGPALSTLRESPSNPTGMSTSKLTASDIGRVHHQFLELICLDRTGSAAALREEAGRLQQQGHLTLAQTAILDYEALAQFWSSSLGQRILSRQTFVHRELPFTVRFSAPEVASLVGLPLEASLEGELVLVQGVVDLAVLAPNEIWLVDFKTDQLDSSELASRVKTYEPQVRLYASALFRVYRRPVSESWLYFLSLKQAVSVQAIQN
jgi:ATP-dependent helicase/nuclease subunit A